jgi:hypothetical protein
MTMPITARERNLVKRSVALCRGLSCPRTDDSELLEENDDYAHMKFDRSEEDLLLPNGTPTCILALPFHLMNAHHSMGVLPIEPISHYIMNRKRVAKTEENMGMLRKYIFPLEKSQSRMLASSTERGFDPLLDIAETTEPQLFLDYLPLLRCMAVQEFIAELVYESVSSQDSEAADSLSNRRNTRRSRKLGRQHYLEVIVPPFVWPDSDFTAKEIGAKLAKLSLVYDKK